MKNLHAYIHLNYHKPLRLDWHVPAFSGNSNILSHLTLISQANKLQQYKRSAYYKLVEKPVLTMKTATSVQHLFLKTAITIYSIIFWRYMRRCFVILHNIFQPRVILVTFPASFLCCIHWVTVHPSKLILNGAFLPRMLQRLSISRASQLCSESYLTEMSRPQTASTMELVSKVVDHLSLGLSDGRVDGSSGLYTAAASARCACTLKSQHR